MKIPVLLILVFIAFVAASFKIARWRDLKDEASTWAELSAQQPASPLKFHKSMISDLPEPAQRFFLFAIEEGTPLNTVVEVSMKGELSLGKPESPNYMPMTAEQILAAPHGFVWKLKAGKGLMRMSGSDIAHVDQSWSRFWLLNMFPVMRAGGNPDHFRSAFGRQVGEAVFWTPAALLPNENVRWDPVDHATAKVTLSHHGLEQEVVLSIDAEGRLIKVVFQRWTDANEEKEFRLQPFGGYLSDYKDIGGYRLPTKVEAGNFFGTDEYFPFFKVSVTGFRFPDASN